MPLGDFAPALREHEGEPFASAKVDADVSTIEDVYRRRGFPAARAQSAVDVPPAPAGTSAVPVTVNIVVTEGARTVVGSVAIEGQPRDSRRAAPAAPAPSARRAVLRLAARGRSRRARAELPEFRVSERRPSMRRPNYSTDRTRVDPVFTVHEGQRIFVDHILIVGNVRTNAGRSSRRSI